MPITITTRVVRGHVEIAVATNAVNGTFLHYILDEIEKAQIRQSGTYLRLLLEVVAPQVDISLAEGFEMFHRALQVGLHGARVAYVVSGRPVGFVASAVETIARNRDIHLRFFEDRDTALEWLEESAAASDVA